MRKELFFALTAWRRLGHFAKILRLRRACSAARRPATLAQFRAPHRQAVVLFKRQLAKLMDTKFRMRLLLSLI